MTIGHVHMGRGFFVGSVSLKYRATAEILSWKSIGTDYKGVLLCLAEAMKKV